MRRSSGGRAAVGLLGLALALSCGPPSAPATGSVQAAYLQGGAGSGFYPNATGLGSPPNQDLRVAWSEQPGATISGQPATANGLVYWSSWDGTLHATRPDGTAAWAADLGTTRAQGCEPPQAGPAGTPVVVRTGASSTLFASGGAGELFALDAITGARRWKARLASPPGEFLWGSPAYFAGAIYLGVSSMGECAAGRGRVIQVDAATGEVRHRLDVVPSGCSGGGIWGSPAVDTSRALIYVATGDADPCPPGTPRAFAVMALRASDLTVADLWQLPSQERGDDSDFGSTPSLFETGAGADRRSLLGLANKNGRYYVLDRRRLARGPVWTAEIAEGGTCPYCGDGSIATSGWDGSRLYVAGGRSHLDSVACAGTLRALDPEQGRQLWAACLAGPALAAPVVVPRAVIVAAGRDLVMLDSASGVRLGGYTDPDLGSAFLASPLPAPGVIYAGSAHGRMLALVPGASS